MIDATPNRYVAFSDNFNELVDKAVEEKRGEETPRDYLGGSRLGVHCERRLGFEYHHHPKDEGRDFSGRVYRIFDRGHDGEERMVEYLHLAGFELEEEKPSGGQWGFAVAQDPETGIYRLRGHADGIIRGGPDKVGTLNMKKRYPMLWENKIINEKRYRELQKKGARDAEWEYYIQCQVYMAYLDLKWALFTAVSANTMHIHAELLELNLEDAQAASDKGVRVVKSLRPEDLPRIARDRTDFRCKWCDYQESCWSEGEPAPEPQGMSIDAIAAHWWKLK